MRKAAFDAKVLLCSVAFVGPLAACGGDDDDSTAPPCGGDGVICNYMGTGRAALGEDGHAPGEVSLYLPQDLAFGPDARPYVLDWNNHRVRSVSHGRVETVIGTGELGDAPNGKASKINLNHPTHVSFSPDGKLVLSAWHNSKVMELSMSSGEIKAICGTGARSYAGEGVPAIEAVVDLPVATAFDSSGRMYIMDQGNQRIRRVDDDGVINTLVGPVGDYLPEGFIEICSDEEPEPGQARECRFCQEDQADDPECPGPPARPQGFAGEGEAGTLAFMNQPFSQSAPPAGGMEMGPDDELYFADTGNHIIRVLHSDGTVETVAGTLPESYDPSELREKAPDGAFEGEGVDALEARFNRPRDVAIAKDGTIFVADTENSCVRRIDRHRRISTVAGTCGERGSAGDGGPASEALLNRPYGVALDENGNLYIADTYNHRIRVVFLEGMEDEH
jgi:DNA-binding beta-propeller fold protein YncE